MPALEIRLLGRPEIRVNGAPLLGLPAKLEALVYYLAISPRSVPRSTLAGLLWSDRSEQDARMNLRAALTKIPPALEPHIVVTRDWLALDRNSEFDIDVQRFDQAVGALSAAAEGPAKRLERLVQVAALYRDEFLSGFASGHAPEFEAWCTNERTRLRQGAIRLLGETLRLRREAGRDDDVVEDARRILQLSPGHDLALRELMEALARSGQRNGAVEEYERHRKLWREDLGISPSDETVRLAERIVAGEALDAPASKGAPPAQLIGREREFALVARLLTDADARIVSITGLGGIGKTRLAQAVMAEVRAHFGDGTHLFSTGAMRSGAALGPAMVAAFGLQMQGKVAPVKYLQDYLREKSMLLVFDSFESVLGTEAVDLLIEILHAAPSVRCLVTSRESLGVAEEAVVAIEGLARPREDDAAWRDAPAVQLFVQRATRGYVQFDPERERAGIVKICERVEGVPLALELAASMARTLPCVEIARAIERDLGTLARDDAGLSPRHRSVVGVLMCAFGQLAPELQSAAARLSAFRGPFPADAADQVADVTLRQLSTLIEKSWLRRDARAGYSMHDMVRQFSAGRREAAGVDARELAKRHAAYFLGMLSTRRLSMQLGEQSATLDELQAVMADVLEACEWGADHAQDAVLEESLEGLFRYYEDRGDFGSAMQTFGALVPRLEKRRGARRTALARGLSCLGWAQAQQAQLEDCKAALTRAIEIARAAGAARIHTEAQRGLALALILQGKPGEVAGLLEECLALSREAGDPYLEVGTLIMLGIAVSYLGSGRGQHDHYQRAIELARPMGFTRGLMIASFNLADALQSEGDLEGAERLFRDCLVYGQRSNNRRHIVMTLANLASIALDRGDTVESRRLVDEAWTMSRVLGDRRSASFLSQAFAELDLNEGQVAEGLEWADRNVAFADEIAWGWSAAFGVALRAEALVRLGERAAAHATVLDLHARSKDTDFGVHHGSVVVEAARWMLAFETAEAARSQAVAALHAIAGPLKIDDWVAKRAKRIERDPAIAAGEVREDNVRELMEAMVAALGSA